MRLKNKIAIVVGASSGLGLSIAKGYKNEGAEVIITYLTKKGSFAYTKKKKNLQTFLS